MRATMWWARSLAILTLVTSSACSDDPGAGTPADQGAADDAGALDRFIPPDTAEDDAAAPDGDASIDALDASLEDAPRDVDPTDDASDDVFDDLGTDTAVDASEVSDVPPSDGDAAGDAADTSEDSPPDTLDGGDGGGPPCEYPIVWTPDPGVEEAAAAALATLAPGAELTWVEQRGTFQRLGSLGLVIECGDDEDLWPQLFALVDANPEVFRMDSSEWDSPARFNCVNVLEFPNRTLTLNRRMMGGERALRDIVSFTLSRVDGEVTLKSVFGAYLPLAPEPITSAMAACPDLELEAARAAALSDTFDYTIFEFCTEVGSGTYTPTQDDTVVLDETPYWGWADDVAGGVVILTKEHVGGLILHPDNVTPELISSDAWCPDEEGDFSAGWDIIFDAVLTTLLSKMPGFGPCIVCFE